MNWTSVTVVALFLTGIVLPACTHTYVPRQETFPIKDGAVPKFSSTQPVAIKNGQDCTEDVLLGSFGMGGRWTGNLNKWTDTAIGYLRTELNKNGIAVEEGATKKLTVAITRAEMVQPNVGIRCTLVFQVETGDGYKKEYEVYNDSMAFMGSDRLKRSADGAVMKAVVAMLNDSRILDYLKS